MHELPNPFGGAAQSAKGGRESVLRCSLFKWRLAANVRPKYGAPPSKIRQAGCKTHTTLRNMITAFLKLLPDESTEGEEVFPTLD